MTKKQAAPVAHADEILTAPVFKPSKAVSVGNRNPANAIPGRAIPEARQRGACTLRHLGAGMCKWPMAMDDDDQRTFCGRPQLAGDRRYCEDHAERSGPSREYLAQERENDARLLKKLGRKGGL